MRRLCLLLTVALLAAGLAGPQRAPGAAAVRDEIQALLDRRAEAMRSGNEEGFMATVDRANPSFVRRQRWLFRGFQRVGVSAYELRITDRLWPGLTTDREVARYGAATTPTVLHVEERSVIDGFDRRPSLEELYLTFVRRQDGWNVASDSDLDDVALRSGRRLWEIGPVATRRSEHFLYVSHPDLRSAGQAILGAAERALGRLNERWPVPWHQRVVILAPSTTEELRRLIQATFDLDVFVAFAYSSVDRARHWELVGHRVLLNWENFGSYPAVSQERILTHELLHIATRDVAGPMVPAFVDEGVADWIAGDTATDALERELADGEFDDRLPRDFEFITGSGTSISAAYQASTSAVRFAADRHGEEAVADLYLTLGGVRLASGTSRYHVGQAMRGAFGVGYDEFERRWADWLERTL
jgi:hypothetical protein